MIVADSDVLIDFLRGREPGHQRIQLELRTGRLATTSINAFELLSGAAATKEHTKVSTLLNAVKVLPLEERAADLAAGVRRNLEAGGNGIGMADYLIAGVCLAHNATLLTRNRDHFSRVPDLQIGGLHGASAPSKP
jgi:tRNA(fMet)-specific endonuclease VapC